MKLAIIGASGHGKVIADIAEQNGYGEIAFYDDNESVASCGKWPVLGPTAMALDGCCDVFIAIGNAGVREMLMERFQGRRFPVLVHPRAVVAEDVILGEGTAVMAGAVINPGARLGRGVIVNTCSSVDHDCIVDDFVHVSVGAHLSGTVSVGKRTWIACGVCVRNNIRICADCMIGAGAAVVKDILEPGTYVGVPARKLEL